MQCALKGSCKEKKVMHQAVANWLARKYDDRLFFFFVSRFRCPLSTQTVENLHSWNIVCLTVA